MSNRGDEQPIGYLRSLVDLLMELRARDGHPAYRDIARRIPSSAGESTSPGYISEVLRGKRVPSSDMAAAIVQALRGDRDSQNRARRYAEEAASDKSRSPTKPTAKQQSAAPQQLPAAVSHFVGRVGELSTLTRLLRGRADRGGTVVISAIGGTAGVGKTALAVYWAHQVAKRFPDGQLYVNLRGFDPSGQTMVPAQAVRRFLDALHVPPERIPMELDAQTALFRSQLAGKRMLVVLDNARDTAQVRPLLPGAPGCLVVVTSRNQLTGLIAADGAHPINLDVLTPAEARKLLARLGPNRVAAESDSVEAIITRCARLPLALTIVAARAAIQPRLPLQVLVDELRDAHNRLNSLVGDDSYTDVRTVFSWSYQALTPDAARLFRLLGLHPGPDITAPAATSLAGLPISAVKPLLGELSRSSLLTEHTPGRYAFHDLLRAYAVDLTCVHETDDQRRAAVDRMLDHYVHTTQTADRLLYPARDPIPLTLTPPGPGVSPEQPADLGAALAWLTTEYPVLLAAVRQAAEAGFDTHTWQLAWTLTTFLARKGHWRDFTTTWQAALDAARRMDDRAAQAYAHRLLATAHTRLRRYPDAHTDLGHALDLYASTDDHIGQAHIHHALGILWGRQDRPELALGHAQQAMTLFGAGGNHCRQARALNAVGWCHALLGDHQQALAHCNQALTMLQEFGDRYGEAAAWDSLGYAHHHLGHHTQAADYYQHALDLVRDLGDRYYEAATLVHVGDAHGAANDPQSARDAWQQALTIFEDLDHPDADKVRAKLNDADQSATSNDPPG